MSRSETPELRSLADKYQGALIIYLGDVSKEEHNKVSETRHVRKLGADVVRSSRKLSMSQCKPFLVWTRSSVSSMYLVNALEI